MNAALELLKVFGQIIHEERDLIYMVLAIIYLVADRMIRKNDNTPANSLSELVETKLVKALNPNENKENENGKTL